MLTGVIFAIMRLFIPATRRPEAMEMLQTVHGHLELSADFVRGWLFEQNHPRSHIVYAEQWKSKQAMFEHIRSELYRHVLSVIDFSTRPPEITFYFVSHTKGMELIYELRDKPQHIQPK